MRVDAVAWGEVRNVRDHAPPAGSIRPRHHGVAPRQGVERAHGVQRSGRALQGGPSGLQPALRGPCQAPPHLACLLSAALDGVGGACPAQVAAHMAKPRGVAVETMPHGAFQALPQLVRPLHLLLDGPRRVHQSPAQGREIAPLGVHTPRHPPRQCGCRSAEPGQQFGFVRHDEFRRRGRGGGAVVRHQVRDGHVRLVAHRGHHRNRAAGDAPRQRFAIECRQVFQGTTAPGQHDEVQWRPQGLRLVEGVRDLRGGFDALHRHRQTQRLHQGIAALQHGQHVPQGGAG